ncbi:MAG TPA: ribonuclease HII, partial [Gemmatimonadales bacterium]|nr:ribonuclease HII [Gemmatimonadales bacterium]
MAPGGPRPTLERERQAWAEKRLLIGVDEAGRGPLAGPVVAAAVVFPFACGERGVAGTVTGRRGRMPVAGLRDSKVLPPRQREKLFPQIQSAALRFAVAAASVREIDRINIRRASALAMRRAVLRLLGGTAAAGATAGFLTLDRCTILIDGLPLPELGLPHHALIDGDAKCCSIAAAGILAKVVRDRLMVRLAARHQGYGWDTNAGYGTDEHITGITA